MDNNTSDEQKYIKTYSIGLMILAFLDQYSLLRFGVYAKMYNTIFSKHEVFLNQIRELKKGKRKGLGEKCLLFRRACFITEKAWMDSMKSTVGMHYTPEAVVLKLCFEDSEMLERLYGITPEYTQTVGKNLSTALEVSEKSGIHWNSYKVANTLIVKLKEYQLLENISQKEGNIDAIK